MSAAVRLRRARPTDAEQIAALLGRAFAEFEPLYTPPAFAATTPGAIVIRRRLSEGPVWVAELDGAIVGTISAVRRDDGVYVRSTAVDPSARGRGAARALLEAVDGFAADERATRIYLSTTPFLADAIRLYERAGFVRTNDPPHELKGTSLFTMARTVGHAGD